jgi:hypothetical protein
VRPMNQLNENFIVVDKEVEHSILPSKKSELIRDIFLKTGFKIHGGIYANNLSAEGIGLVDGPIMAKGEIRLKIRPYGYQNDRMLFRKGINSGRAVMVETSEEMTSSPTIDCSYSPLVIRGDVNSGIVHLENAIVLGNIYCDKAYIKNSIILGNAFVTSRLDIDSVIMISFNAGTVGVHGRNSLWVPFGMVKNEIIFNEIDPDEEDKRNRILGQSNEVDPYAEDVGIAWIRYIGLCSSPEHGCGRSDIACINHIKGTCKYNDVRMRSQDTFRAPKGDDHSVILSITPRLLDLTKIQSALSDITTLIQAAMLFDHFDAESKRELLDCQFPGETKDLMNVLSTISLPRSDL